jgi:hypothetical protein
MVGPSKILTVSYGTFSCTLEGFDDPFSTMKAIAEYFRDLAADDRYFGAEPPQPDAAMLHRIAEREVHRRVEARVQDNGVILRAADGAGPAAATPAMPAFVPAGAATPLSESVAAKLQRLRNAAAAAPTLVPVPEEAEIVTEAPTAALAAAPIEFPVVAPVVAPVAAPVAAPAAEPPAAASPPEVPAAEEMAVADAPEAAAQPETDPATDAATTPEDEGQAIAADVEDAPAVSALAEDLAETAEADIDVEALLAEAIEDWGQPEPGLPPAAGEAASAETPAQAADPAAPVVEDEADQTPAPAAAPAAPAFDDDPDLMESLAAALAEPAAEPAAPAAPQAAALSAADDADLMESLAAALADPSDTLAAEADFMLAALTEAEDDAESPTARPEDAAEDSMLAPLVEEEAEEEAEVFATGTTAQEAAALVAAPVPPVEPAVETVADTVADTAPTADDAPVPAITAAEAVPAAAEPPAPAVEPAEAAPVRPQRARARVIKIRRADSAAPPAPVAPEIEADLARALDSARDEPARDETPARPQLPEVAEGNSVQRLIDQTNTQLDGAESRRRLAAIAHLKAAVAATVADREATGGAADPAEETRLNAYRSDLERVVRPRRPVPAQGEAQTTAVPLRPAPLVLVSAQRIDRPAPAAPAAPVRPRRVAGAAPLAAPAGPRAEDDASEAEDENLIVPAAGFAEFAERLGAQDLADLLEAAVAYAACVEGRPHVSRPYMLRQVGTMIEDGEARRDEMLRGFGRLLRGGRIEKVRAGMYALPGSSRLMAEARKLAG